MKFSLIQSPLENPSELIEVNPSSFSSSDSRPILFIAPGFLAQSLNPLEQQEFTLGEKPIRFAIKTTKEMIAQSGMLLEEYPEIICIAWGSGTACKEELYSMLSDPMFISESAREFRPSKNFR